MNLLFIFLLITSSAFAYDEKFLADNNIILKTENIADSDIEDFISEFNKFPVHLKNEMISRKAKIHLIHGQGVTDDPSWGLSKKTFDGRGWENVPGAGGNPRSGRPTRIVVNRLYEGHGSVNLFLHEHAHALDSTYKTDGVSHSKEWKKVLENSPNAEEFLKRICKNDYCLVKREGFAELFSRYFHDESMKAEIENELPLIAEFFQNLTSIKKLPKGQAETKN